MHEKFVVAFRGRRDYYEVPLALAETNSLAALVTDRYLPSLGGITGCLGHVVPPLTRRHRAGLRSGQVITTDTWTRRRRLSDEQLGAYAADVAYSVGAIPLIYSYYLKGFLAARRADSAAPVVFQVHPLAAQVREAMADCHEMDSMIEREPEEQMGETEVLLEVERLRSLGGRIICASSCTKAGLTDSGLEPSSIRRIMYGGDRYGVRPVNGPIGAGRLRVLYIGQVSRRKGIGSMLSGISLLDPSEIALTIVTRDPRIETYRAAADRIGAKITRSSDRALEEIFAANDVLVLPSYIEGAGLVLSEAAVAGLWIVGTPMSAAPELIDQFHRGTLINPGRPAELADVLNKLAAQRVEIRQARNGAVRCHIPSGPTWQKFRTELRDSVDLSAQ